MHFGWGLVIRSYHLQGMTSTANAIGVIPGQPISADFTFLIGILILLKLRDNGSGEFQLTL